MIDEATVDAYGAEEQRVGFHALMEERLLLPFETTVLGVTVTVERLDVAADGSIVAVCRRGSQRQAISLLDLPLPEPAPIGVEWIEAYRRWSQNA